MAQNTLSDFIVTPASNTSYQGTGILGSDLVSTADDAFRTLAAMLKSGVVTGYTTTATAAGTTTLTANSNSYQYFTGVTTQTITMPVTSTLELGREWIIVNNSTGSLTVNSSGANLIVTVLAGQTVHVQCILITGTSAASWSVSGTGQTGLFANGTAALPSISFASDPDTGMYRIGANNIGWAVNGAIELDLNSARLAPGVSGGSALGSTTLQWADLFLADNAVVNFNNGDVTITHNNGSGGSLAFFGAANGYSFNTGPITLLSGQIAFPAVQVASADANTLDDYEEGTWTITITFNATSAGVVYVTQTGFYRKIGGFVAYYGNLVLSNNGSGVGVASVGGLPFNVLSLTVVGSMVISAGGSAIVGPTGLPVVGTATILPFVQGTTTATQMTDTNLTDTTNMTFAGSYMAA